MIEKRVLTNRRSAQVIIENNRIFGEGRLFFYVFDQNHGHNAYKHQHYGQKLKITHTRPPFLRFPKGYLADQDEPSLF